MELLAVFAEVPLCGGKLLAGRRGDPLRQRALYASSGSGRVGTCRGVAPSCLCLELSTPRTRALEVGVSVRSSGPWGLEKVPSVSEADGPVEMTPGAGARPVPAVAGVFTSS